MINIFIDTRSISEEFSLDQSQIDDLLDFTIKEVTGRFAQEWENEAFRTLKSSRQEYISNIVVVDEGFARGAVMLTGILPNMVESGAEGFDIKEGLLNGPNAKTGKNGKKYNTVPFGFGTPGALVENFSGGLMPEEIYSIIKQRDESEPLQKYDLKDVPTELKQQQKKQVKMPESKSFKEYQHKHSIYEGISKKKDAVTGQNSYVSFRRVSEVSDEASWQHPGIEAVNLSEKVLNGFDVDKIVGRAFDKWLDNI